MSPRCSILTTLSALCACVLAPSASSQQLLHVPSQYSTIQAAIDGAANGDSVLVAPGTYFEHIDFHGKTIEVTSTSGPEVTTIDGGGSGSVVRFTSGEPRAAVLERFTITNGSGSWYGASGISPVLRGGGILCGNASPTIRGNVIARNSATEGGGIFCERSSAVITGNRIESNLAHKRAGIGFYNRYHDYADGARAIVEGNVIVHNHALAPFEGAGGGIGCDWTKVLIVNNVIAGNSAHWRGGGVEVWDNFGGESATLVNNTIYGNTAGRWGGGIYSHHSSPAVWNTIVWGNTAQAGSQIYNYFPGSYQAAVSYSDVMGGYAGTGNLNTDPLFVNPAMGDFHLALGSPCIDKGTNTAPHLPATDFDGEPRIAGGRVDIGADEYHPLTVPVDIKPQSCPNPLNVISRGVLPVALLGTAGFRLDQIDTSSIELAGVRPSMIDVADVGTPFGGQFQGGCRDCTAAAGDGLVDLVLLFDKRKVIEALGSVSDRQCVVVSLTGRCTNGRTFRGEDVVQILKN